MKPLLFITCLMLTVSGMAQVKKIKTVITPSKIPGMEVVQYYSDGAPGSIETRIVDQDKYDAYMKKKIS